MTTDRTAATAGGDALLIETDGRVRILTLNRPNSANALDPPLTRALITELRAVSADDAIVAVIIAAAGNRHFCAGADLKSARVADEGGRQPSVFTRRRPNLLDFTLEVPKPVIVAVEGAAYGAGLELALACDIRIVGANAVFASPEARRGLTGHFASIMLPRIAPSIAMHMLFTGAPIDAAEAYRSGIATRLVPAGSALAEARATAAMIAKNAPGSLRRMKRTSLRSSGLPLAAALVIDEGPDPAAGEDRKEGARAFLEGREPIWTGR